MEIIIEKKYKGQALAVVMIVLVVAVVMGMAMFSRTLRDRQRVIEEKASAEALELSDSILDVMSGTPVEVLSSICSDPVYGNGLDSSEGCQVKGASAVTNFLEGVGASTDFLDSFKSCTSNGSDVSMNLSLATGEDDYEVRQDSVRSFVIRQQQPQPASCRLDLQFEPRGGANAGVSVSKVYTNDYSENGIPSLHKPYEYTDILQYCLIRDGGTCPDNTIMSGSWTPLVSGSTLSVPLSGSGEYAMDEIRVRAVNSSVGMKFRLSDNRCVEDLEMIKIVVEANCTGSYRAKEIQIPQQEWALPLFDYVIFNGTGSLSPN